MFSTAMYVGVREGTLSYRSVTRFDHVSELLKRSFCWVVLGGVRRLDPKGLFDHAYVRSCVRFSIKPAYGCVRVRTPLTCGAYIYVRATYIHRAFPRTATYTPL